MDQTSQNWPINRDWTGITGCMWSGLVPDSCSEIMNQSWSQSWPNQVKNRTELDFKALDGRIYEELHNKNLQTCSNYLQNDWSKWIAIAKFAYKHNTVLRNCISSLTMQGILTKPPNDPPQARTTICLQVYNPFSHNSVSTSASAQGSASPLHPRISYQCLCLSHQHSVMTCQGKLT
jgi:hypothetical protein